MLKTVNRKVGLENKMEKVVRQVAVGEKECSVLNTEIMAKGDGKGGGGEYIGRGDDGEGEE